MDAPRRRLPATALALAIALSPLSAETAPKSPDAPIVAPTLHVSAQVPIVKTGEAHLVEARWAAAIAAAGHYVYVAGGDSLWNGAPVGSVERLDVATGRSEVFAQLRHPRSMAGVVIADGKLYVIGGRAGRGGIESPASFPDFAGPGEHMRGLSEEYLVKSGKIGPSGSLTIRWPLLFSVEVIDLATGQVTAGPEMPEGRSSFGCVLQGRRIFVIGGRFLFGVKEGFTNRTLVLDLDTQRWSEGVPMPQPGETAAALVDDFIVTTGGYDSVHQFDAVSAFSPTVQRWRELPALVKPVSAHALVRFGRHLLLFGNYTHPDELVSYDLVTKTSEAFTLHYTPLRNAAAAALDGRIYIVGGKPDIDHDPSDLVQIFEAPPKLAQQ